jgi:hypothetical protein
VLAVYAIYTGDLVLREPLACLHNGQAGRDSSSARPGPEEVCLPCRKMAISMVTAYQLNTGWYDPR